MINYKPQQTGKSNESKFNLFNEKIINESLDDENERNKIENAFLLSNLYNYFEKLSQGYENAIIYIENAINQIIQTNDTFLSELAQIQIIGLIIPLLQSDVEYGILRSTLSVLFLLSTVDQPDDSLFQELQLAEKLTCIIESSSEQPTLRGKALKILINLLDLQNIGPTVFINLIRARLIVVIKNSDIFSEIKPDQESIPFNKMSTRDKSIKVLKNKNIIYSAELMMQMAKYCQDDHLTLFTTFYNEIVFFLTNKLETDKKEKAKLFFLGLLSVMLKHQENRMYAYQFQIPEKLLQILTLYKDDFLKYSFDAIYEFVSNDGLHPCFKSMAFYNLTRNAIQQRENIYVLTSIYRAISAIISLDWEGIWENEILSDIYDLMTIAGFKYRIESGLIILRFFECCKSEECLLSMIQNKYLDNLCSIIIDCFDEKNIIYFIDVLGAVTEISNEILLKVKESKEVFNTIEELKMNENQYVANYAEKLGWHLWNDNS